MNVHDFWKAVLAQDELEIRKYFQEDAYINWHCTNEHFNLDEYIIANCEYPGEWGGVVERIDEMQDLLVTVVNVYPKDRSMSFHVTSFITKVHGCVCVFSLFILYLFSELNIAYYCFLQV